MKRMAKDELLARLSDVIYFYQEMSEEDRESARNLAAMDIVERFVTDQWRPPKRHRKNEEARRK